MFTNLGRKGQNYVTTIGKISFDIGGVPIITKIIELSDTPLVRDYLMGLLEADTTIILTHGNKVLATLTPVGLAATAIADRVPDLYPGMWVSDDFDDLLPGEYWLTNQT